MVEIGEISLRAFQRPLNKNRRTLKRPHAQKSESNHAVNGVANRPSGKIYPAGDPAPRFIVRPLLRSFPTYGEEASGFSSFCDDTRSVSVARTPVRAPVIVRTPDSRAITLGIAENLKQNCDLNKAYSTSRHFDIAGALLYSRATDTRGPSPKGTNIIAQGKAVSAATLG